MLYVLFFSPNFFDKATTVPLNANNANAFGITINALKKSASDHTMSTFNIEPMIINTNTMPKYTFAAFLPNK